MPSPAFPGLQPAAPDSILGVAAAFRADPREGKVSLAVGVYQDEAGQTPILATVAEAERRLAAKGASKTYRPIAGDVTFTGPVRALVFGEKHPALGSGRVETLHTPGGTGGLRVAADLVHRLVPAATVWLSTPTWPNHPQIFEAAGFRIGWYPYLFEDSSGLDLDGMLAALGAAARGDVVVVHACCHNPTGLDLPAEGWARLTSLVTERGLLPLLDFAYQGFGDGLDEDAAGVRALAAEGCTLLVASSLSKNFAAYAERVGALSSEHSLSSARPTRRQLHSLAMLRSRPGPTTRTRPHTAARSWRPSSTTPTSGLAGLTRSRSCEAGSTATGSSSSRDSGPLAWRAGRTPTSTPTRSFASVACFHSLDCRPDRSPGCATNSPSTSWLAAGSTSPG
jgi:aspartate/tyrosine/aromatic aminotransferase